MRASASAIAGLAGSALLLLAPTPAVAAQCAQRPVEARGEASRYETLAKLKARGNWRAKVRAMPDLGAAYANWSKAAGADYRCSQSHGDFVCVAVATPCRD